MYFFLFSVPEFIVFAPHPVLHAIRALHNTHHQAHLSLHSPSHPKPSVCFSESTVSNASSPSPISPSSLFLSFSPCPPCYSWCCTSKWNHMIIDSLCLTYFTQHNLLQSHPCWCKSWVFILSDGGIIFHCIYGPYLLYPFICWRASWLWPLLLWTLGCRWSFFSLHLLSLGQITNSAIAES